MRQSLVGLGITLAASAPETPKAQSEVVQALAAARRGTPIPAAVLREVGTRFIETAQSVGSAWEVALELASYKSSTNAQYLKKGQSFENVRFTTRYQVTGPTGTRRTQMTWIGVLDAGDDIARLEKLAEPIKQEKFGNKYIVLTGGTVTLDEYRFRHIIFNEVEVYYSGGPSELDDVTFVNCKFKFENNERTRNLSHALLAESQIKFNAS